jgi:hypothetical protein
MVSFSCLFFSLVAYSQSPGSGNGNSVDATTSSSLPDSPVALAHSKGQRTGYTTKYSEHLLSYGQWIGSTVLFRPELRLEHSYDLKAYDLGAKTQFLVAGDVTYHF